jgi:hypothetical protein
MAYGVLGFVVGLKTYDFTNGSSLLRLSILSMVGYVFTILLVVVNGIVIEVYSLDAGLLYIMLPMITMGIPTLLFMTPVAARIWHEVKNKFAPT